MVKYTRAFAIAFALCPLLAAGVLAQVLMPSIELLEGIESWRDSITVAEERYAIPEFWRGLRLGLDDQPAPPDLVPVPPELRIASREPVLRAPALAAFRALAEAAALDSIELRIRSGYRAPGEQIRLIASRIAAGREFDVVIRGVAPPGYSEHMLGMTVDLELGRDYLNNPSYLWLKENAASFGWRESYPRLAPTGFPWEPWHWRFVGMNDEELGMNDEERGMKENEQ